MRLRYQLHLFAKDMLRSALADEVEELGPQVPLVSKPITFACRAERLARAGACPDRFIIRPSTETQGMRPDANSGEEVALRESSQVVRWDNTYRLTTDEERAEFGQLMASTSPAQSAATERQ